MESSNFGYKYFEIFRKNVSVTIFDLGICFEMLAFQRLGIFLQSFLNLIAPSAAVVVFDIDFITPSDRAIQELHKCFLRD